MILSALHKITIYVPTLMDGWMDGWLRSKPKGFANKNGFDSHTHIDGTEVAAWGFSVSAV